MIERQRRHWAEGDCSPLESFLAEAPDLERDAQALLELVQAELALRAGRGAALRGAPRFERLRSLLLQVERTPPEMARRRSDGRLGPAMTQDEADLAKTSAPGAGSRVRGIIENQRHHWAEGDCSPLESFLIEAPELERDAQALLELVQAEVALRRERGEAPRYEEYADRFPLLAETLHGQFETRVVHRGLPAVPGYQVLGELGRGGAGVVYVARQTALKRLVALKMIKAGALADDNEPARLRGEAEAAAALQHPNIVQIFEVGEHQGLPFIALEFVPGGSLAQQMKDQPPAPREAAALVRTLALAIHTAHEVGIVHRDLKPGNVLLTRDGTPKISDFGLAKRLGDAPELTATGAILGSPAYMSPEQAWGDNARVGPASDIHALGAVLYHLLVGRPPFVAADGLQTVLLVRLCDPVPPRRLQPALDRDLETICLCCLAKDPRRRYGSARALAHDLLCYLDGLPIAARPAGRIERALKWIRRRPAAAALAGVSLAAALLLAGGGLWSLRTLRAAWRAERNSASQARRQRARAEERELAARRTLYAIRINLAFQAWAAGDGSGLWSLLEAEHLPVEAVDLRGFEWRLLRRMLNLWQSVVEPDNGALHAVRSLPGGGLVVAGESPDVLLLAPDGRKQAQLGGHAPPVRALAAGPRGVATGDARGVVRLWDAGKLLARWQFSTRPVRCLRMSPDGRWLAVAGDDGAIRLCELNSGRSREVARRPGAVSGLAFTPGGKRLASVGADRMLRIDPVAGGAGLALGPFNAALESVAISPDGRWLATGGTDRLVRLWRLDRGGCTEQKVLAGHGRLVGDVAFGPRSATLASASVDGTLRLWDVPGGRCWSILLGHSGPVQSLHWSEGGETLASAGIDGKVWRWRLADCRSGTILPLRGGLRCAAFSSGGGTLAGGSAKGLVLWRAGGEKLAEAQRPAPPLALAVAPDGRLAAGGAAGSIELRDRALRVLREVRSGPAVWALAFAPGGRLLASGHEDGAVRLWDAATLAPRGALRGGARIKSLRFSPDGALLVTRDGAGAVRVWELRARRERRRLEGWRIRAIAISPDGRQLACGGEDGSLVCWSLADGQRIDAFVGHQRPVVALAWSADGRTLASGGEDGALKLWHVATRQQLAVLRWHGEALLALRFSPDGRRLASASVDGMVRLWDAAVRKR